jgi:uncharacterized membrane protein
LCFCSAAAASMDGDAGTRAGALVRWWPKPIRRRRTNTQNRRTARAKRTNSELRNARPGRDLALRVHDGRKSPPASNQFDEAVRSVAHRGRTSVQQRVVNQTSEIIARPSFVAVLAFGVAAWIGVNLIVVAFGCPAFDAPGFLWLQGAMNLFSLFIVTLVLVAQKHADELNARRDNRTLELAILSERKIAKVLEELRRDSPQVQDRVDRQADQMPQPAERAGAAAISEAASDVVSPTGPKGQKRPRDTNQLAKLVVDKIIGALVEGNSIRSTERTTDTHRDTVMRLMVEVGTGCARLMDEQMRLLRCKRIQVDEIWAYVGKKQRAVTREDDKSRVGDDWTFVAIDAETKLVPCFRVGKRTKPHAIAFMGDLSERLANRVQLSSDALQSYVDAVEQAFGADVGRGLTFMKPSLSVMKPSLSVPVATARRR